MRVEKIDIKKETIAIPDGQNYFEEFYSPNTKFNFFDSVNPVAEKTFYKKRTYNIVRVVDNYGETSFFGVEQEKLFQDILNIGNTELNTIKARA